MREGRRIVVIITRAMLMALLVGALGSCESTQSPTRDVRPSEVWLWEAERAALILGEEPADVPELVEAIAQDLADIRSRFNWLMERNDYRVHYPWYPRELWIFLSPEGEDLLREGPWPEFDALVAGLDVDTMKVHGGWVVLILSAARNLCLLADDFLALDHVVGASPEWRVFTCSEGCGIIWPQRTDGGMLYVFELRKCSRGRYTVFRALPSVGVQLVGYYDPRSEPPPRWWDEIDPPYFEYTCD